MNIILIEKIYKFILPLKSITIDKGLEFNTLGLTAKKTRNKAI